MRLLRRLRQFGVDCRGEWMHQLRPGRIVEPQRRAAFPAEIALAGRDLAMRVLVILDLGAIDAEIALAGNLQRRRIRAEIDGETAAALLLAADRAVAELVRYGRMAVDREADGAAAARTFEFHGHSGSRRICHQVAGMRPKIARAGGKASPRLSYC